VGKGNPIIAKLTNRKLASGIGNTTATRSTVYISYLKAIVAYVTSH